MMHLDFLSCGGNIYLIIIKETRLRKKTEWDESCLTKGDPSSNWPFLSSFFFPSSIKYNLKECYFYCSFVIIPQELRPPASLIWTTAQLNQFWLHFLHILATIQRLGCSSVIALSTSLLWLTSLQGPPVGSRLSHIVTPSKAHDRKALVSKST